MIRAGKTLSEGAALLERFLPALPELAIQSYITGPSTYTPDGLFVLGAAPGRGDGLLLATGCCGAGIAASGGIGRALAALAADQTPPFDLDAVPARIASARSIPSIRRFAAAANRRGRGRCRVKVWSVLSSLIAVRCGECGLFSLSACARQLV
jgi:sarcosine oxidase subunit beta